MVSEVALVHNGQIYDDKNFQKGFRIDIKTYDKCMIWSPKHINKMHFEAGNATNIRPFLLKNMT